MKVFDTLIVGLVLWSANELVDSKITCSKDEYIVDANGTESCLPCNHCPHGQGLSPPCGSKVNHPPPIDCVPCIPGKTYSDGHNPSSCKTCHLCSAKEIVIRNCTVYDNTICSKTCEEGYYYEHSTHNCQPCSDCCNKDEDVRITQCKSMPSNKQCSVLSTRQCKPEPTTAVATAYPSETTSVTKKPSTGGPEKPSTEWNAASVTTAYHRETTSTVTKKPCGSKRISTEGIVFSVIGVFVAIILVIVVSFFYKRRNNSRRRNNNCNVRYNPRREVLTEDGAVNHLLNNDEHCDLDYLSWSITNKSPKINEISEGQRILLSLIRDNENGDVQENNRQCSFGFEWKKDGDSISKNNHQNYFKDLKIDDVEVADSGRYCCEIHCIKHQDHKQNSYEEIHVNPGEGKEWKLFSELNCIVEEKLINLLTPKTVGIGHWMDLGREFGMDEDVLKALDKDQASQVLQYIKSICPELTVFEFCKVLKRDTMKQKKIVKFLENELTKTKKNAKSVMDASNRPDSGISEESYSYGDGPVRAAASSKLSPPKTPALLNLSFADSSREASRESSLEDITSSAFLIKVQNSKPVEEKRSKGLKLCMRRKKSEDISQNSSEEDNDSKDDKKQDQKSDVRKNSRYGRQTSKDSQKSDDNEDVGTRERKRSRSSSFTDSIREIVGLKTPPVEYSYSPLDRHHEESDEGM